MVALPLAEGHLVQGGHGACEEAPQLLAPLFDGLCGISVDGDGEGGVEKPLSSSMHLVPQTAGVFQGDLRLGRCGLAPLQRDGDARLHLHPLPLQCPDGLGGGDGRDVDGEVHGQTQGQDPLHVSQGQRPGPAGQLVGPAHALAKVDMASAQADGHGAIHLGSRGCASPKGGLHQEAQSPVLEGEDGEARPDEKALKLAGPRLLADGVEASVHHAGALFKLGEELPQGGRSLGDPLGKVRGTALFQGVPQGSQPGRVLAHQQLDGKLQGVEHGGEGAHDGLLHLQPPHLHDGDLRTPEADDGLIGHPGDGQVAGQERWELGRLRLAARGLRRIDSRDPIGGRLDLPFCIR